MKEELLAIYVWFSLGNVGETDPPPLSFDSFIMRIGMKLTCSSEPYLVFIE